MRRALVLSTESSRHPFRAALPLGALAVDEMENRRYWRTKFGLDEGDARYAAQMFSAGFIATAAFFY